MTLITEDILEKSVQFSVNFLEVCASYTGNKEKTNMVVIEIELLSGFEPSTKALEDLKKYPQIKKVEYDETSNIVASYFNEFPKKVSCHKFKLTEVIKVEERKPALAKIYDYYDQKDIYSIEYS